MDGALGTELQRAGLHPGEPGERWNLTRPAEVRAVHAAYARAGAEVLLTNTFQANPTALARHGLESQLEAMNQAAVRLARAAVGAGGFVLGDVGPILGGAGHTEFADRAALRRVLASLEGVDGVLFETCSSPAALAAVEYALHRAPEVEGLPLLLSLTYHRDPAGQLVTFSGHPPETYARHAERHGVAALGVNCGKDVGLDEVLEILRRYKALTDLPLFARPNAGSPRSQESGVRGQKGVGERRPQPLTTHHSPSWVYPRGPDEMAARVLEVVQAGARMVGGCCGTSPATIARFQEVLGVHARREGDA
jgi:5-methyltetrahydrofolate--homocysteine methyltransferase